MSQESSALKYSWFNLGQTPSTVITMTVAQNGLRTCLKIDALLKKKNDLLSHKKLNIESYFFSFDSH